jgi:Tol biopolymer transport system component/DNA-binding winged helix-turn-helix (wHTH) protein
MIPATAPYLRFDDVVVDLSGFSVTKSGRKLDLEPRAFHLLRYLLERPGRLVTKDELIQEVWRGAFVTDNALTRVIAQLRRELGDSAKSARYIETVPTQGYRFLAVVESIETLDAPPMSPAAPPRSRRILASAATAVLLLGAGALLTTRFTAPDSPATIQSVQFTSTNGLQLGSSFSPDGNMLAYASDKTGRFEIYTRSITPGGRETALTSDGLQNLMPAWSPDGNWIAYHSAAQNALRVVPASGGTPRTVSDFGLEPTWSPDSKRIVFRSGVYLSPIAADFGSLRPSRLYIVNLDGGAPAPLTALPTTSAGQVNPCWPNSSDSVFFLTASSMSRSTLWRLRMDGASQPEQVRSGGDQLWFALATDPDGKRIYLSSASKNAQFSIVTIDPAGTNPPRTILQTGLLMPRGLAVSSKGKLAYSLALLSSNLYRLPLNPRTGDQAGPIQELTQETGARVTLPTFSPNGALVAYNARRMGVDSDIYVVPSLGGEPQQVTTNPAPEVMPNWLADGRTLVFTRKEGDKTILVRVTLDDARTREIKPLDQGPTMARVSPAGDQFLFQSWAAGHVGLYLSNLKREPPKQITPPGEDIGFPSWSPDGSRIAAEKFENDTTHLIVLDTKGGPYRRLTNVPGQSWPHSWAADNDHIAFAGMRGGLWGLYSISASTGKQKTLLEPGLARGFVRYPSWSPRGDMIVFERAESRGNIFLLDLP